MNCDRQRLESKCHHNYNQEHLTKCSLEESVSSNLIANICRMNESEEPVKPISEHLHKTRIQTEWADENQLKPNTKELHLWRMKKLVNPYEPLQRNILISKCKTRTCYRKRSQCTCGDETVHPRPVWLSTVCVCGGGQSWGLSVHRWGTDRVVSEHFLTPSLLFICLLMASTSPSANQTIDLIRAGSPFHSEDGSMLASRSGGSAHLNITVNELPASHTWGGVYLLSSHQVKNLKWEINWTYLR